MNCDDIVNLIERSVLLGAYSAAGSTVTSTTTATNTLNLDKLKALIDAMPPEPWAEFMRAQGKPPEEWTLFLPPCLAEPYPKLLPKYVRVSKVITMPVVLRLQDFELR